MFVNFLAPYSHFGTGYAMALKIYYSVLIMVSFSQLMINYFRKQND